VLIERLAAGKSGWGTRESKELLKLAYGVRASTIRRISRR
jgi:hypothetical protein